MYKRIILYALPLLLLLAAVALWAITRNSGNNDDPDANDFDSVRNIYIGDIITLKVNSLAYTADELTSLFQGFEVIDIKKEADGFLLSLRTFTIGERKVFLGNKEIIVNVSSTLDDIERDSIFQGDIWVTKPGFLFYWQILLCAAAGVFALSGGFMLVKVIKRRRENALSPMQLFVKRCSTLCPDDDSKDRFFVDLTFYFKQYLEGCYHCRIIGKTSIEIINELENIQAVQNIRAINIFLPEIQQWLTECDRLKFSGLDVTAEEKKGHYAILYDLVIKIDQTNEEAA